MDVTEDAGGDAGSNTTFAIDMKSTAVPEEYTYVSEESKNKGGLNDDTERH